MKIKFCSRECAEAFVDSLDEDEAKAIGFIELLTMEVDSEMLCWGPDDRLSFEEAAHNFNLGWIAARKP